MTAKDSDQDGLDDNVEFIAGGNPARFDMPMLSVMQYFREANLVDCREPAAANRHVWVSGGYRTTYGSGFNGIGTRKNAWIHFAPWQSPGAINASASTNSFFNEDDAVADPLPWGTAESSGTTLYARFRESWNWEAPYRVHRITARQVRYFIQASRAMPLELKVRAVTTLHARSGYPDQPWEFSGPFLTQTLTLQKNQTVSNEITLNPADFASITPPPTTDLHPRTTGDKYYSIQIQGFPYQSTSTDSDGDGLPDTVETSMGTLADNPDGDRDGRADFFDFVSSRPGVMVANPEPDANPVPASSANRVEEPKIEYVFREGHVCPTRDFSKRSTDTTISVQASHWELEPKQENVSTAPGNPFATIQAAWAAQPEFPLTLPAATAPQALIYDESKLSNDQVTAYTGQSRYTAGSPAGTSLGIDAREVLLRLRRETGAPTALSRNLLIVNRQKADTSAATWTYNSMTVKTLTIPANQTTSPIDSPANNPLKLPSAITPPANKSSMHEVYALAPVITLEDNQAGVIGDTIASLNPGSTVTHFVTPKKNPDTTALNGDYVELKATGIKAAEFADILEWEGGLAGSAPNKRKVSRNTPNGARHEVKLKAKVGGSVVAQMNVWVVWSTCTATSGTAQYNQYNEFDPIQGTSKWEILATEAGAWKFKFTIVPANIIDPDNSERPDLTGANNRIKNPPPGDKKPFLVLPRLGAADTAENKWDLSRQQKVTIRNPSGIPKKLLQTGGYPDAWFESQIQPVAIAVDFPSGAEGNDDADQDNPDEDTNPYQIRTGSSAGLDHARGQMASVDIPNFTTPNGWGKQGRSLIIEYNFREFARVALGDGQRAVSPASGWFRISDYKDWHFYLNTTFNDTSKTWLNTGSSSGFGHPTP